MTTNLRETVVLTISRIDAALQATGWNTGWFSYNCPLYLGYPHRKLRPAAEDTLTAAPMPNGDFMALVQELGVAGSRIHEELLPGDDYPVRYLLDVTVEGCA